MFTESDMNSSHVIRKKKTMTLMQCETRIIQHRVHFGLYSFDGTVELYWRYLLSLRVSFDELN